MFTRVTETETAARLTRLTRGQIEVFFTPHMTLLDDKSSQGHLYLGLPLITDNEGEMLWLDDRRSEPLEQQLVAALRRVARLYAALAHAVEAARRSPSRPKPSSPVKPAASCP